MSDGLEQAAHLALPPFGKHEREDSAVRLGGEGTGAERARGAVLELDAEREARERVARERAAHARVVLALHPRGRVQEPVREIAVVGEQEETFGLTVQAADVMEHA